MQKYSIVQVGLGPRGVTHLLGFLRNRERLSIAGVCDLAPDRLSSIGQQFAVPQERWYQDAETMLRETRPDILSFCTLPAVRLSMVELAVQYGVKGLLFEKPMATTLTEAKKMTDFCVENGIKAVVCHQHKYLEGFQIIQEMIARGDIGQVERINAECQPWLSQLGTHYMDYVIWASGGARPISVAGHVHGRHMLTDSHPSPDYFLGETILENGVRSTIQFGYFARNFREHHEDYEKGDYPIDFWEDDRLTVYGSHGYVWAECNGRWGAFTKRTNGECVGGHLNAFRDELEDPRAQELYTREFIAWMDGAVKQHSCNIEQAYAGYEALEAMCLSALDHTRMDLPLAPLPQEDALVRMQRELKETARRDFKT